MGFIKTPQELFELSQMKIEFYNAEMVFAFWLTRQDIVERLLPPPLKPTGLPIASAFIANYPKTSFGPPYQEGALFLMAQYEGVAGNYCLAMPVTGDMAMAGGREQFGFPKKLAQHIQLAQSNDDIVGFVERMNVRFFELRFSHDEQAVDGSFKAMIQHGFGFDENEGAGTYLYKCFMAPDNPLFDYPPRLIRQTTVFRPKTIEWGQAQINMIPSRYDPWVEVEVVSTIGAMRIIGDNTMLSGKILTEVDPTVFAPYAFNRWDW